MLVVSLNLLCRYFFQFFCVILYAMLYAVSSSAFFCSLIVWLSYFITASSAEFALLKSYRTLFLSWRRPCAACMNVSAQGRLSPQQPRCNPLPFPSLPLFRLVPFPSLSPILPSFPLYVPPPSPSLPSPPAAKWPPWNQLWGAPQKREKKCPVGPHKISWPIISTIGWCSENLSQDQGSAPTKIRLVTYNAFKAGPWNANLATLVPDISDMARSSAVFVLLEINVLTSHSVSDDSVSNMCDAVTIHVCDALNIHISNCSLALHLWYWLLSLIVALLVWELGPVLL